MVCRDFILPEPASYVFFYAIFNLRNLLYIICYFSYDIIRLSFTYEKKPLSANGYFGYEYELSVHLNIAHNSFTLVRVLRAGAFCLFQFIFERSNKEPSPERIRSERGREDKPLIPVLYSTREGGELYGAIFFRQGKNTTSV